MKRKLSIIIPVYKEANLISSTLDTLFSLQFPIPFEIIIADGEPGHSTLARLEEYPGLGGPIKRVKASKGRGPQLNAGAEMADGDLFFFLHADTRVDQKGMDLMIKAWRDHVGSFFCGAFDLSIDSEKKVFRIIEKTASFRSRFFKIPYGDQGIFMSRPLFEQIGGFPDTPIMEDVGLMSRVKKASITPTFLPHAIATSSRRWENQGVIFTTLRNWTLMILYFLGISPRTLAKYY